MVSSIPALWHHIYFGRRRRASTRAIIRCSAPPFGFVLDNDRNSDYVLDFLFQDAFGYVIGVRQDTRLRLGFSDGGRDAFGHVVRDKGKLDHVLG